MLASLSSSVVLRVSHIIYHIMGFLSIAYVRHLAKISHLYYYIEQTAYLSARVLTRYREYDIVGMTHIRQGGIMTNNLISTKEAAVILNVSARTVVRWIHDGRLPGAVKVNPRAFAIPKESVIDLAKSRRPEPPPELNAACGSI